LLTKRWDIQYSNIRPDAFASKPAPTGSRFDAGFAPTPFIVHGSTRILIREIPLYEPPCWRTRWDIQYSNIKPDAFASSRLL